MLIESKKKNFNKLQRKCYIFTLCSSRSSGGFCDHLGNMRREYANILLCVAMKNKTHCGTFDNHYYNKNETIYHV